MHKFLINLAKVLREFTSDEYKKIGKALETYGPFSKEVKLIKKTLIKTSFDRAKVGIKKKKSKR